MSEAQNTEAPSAEQPQEGADQQADSKSFDAEYVDKLRKEAAKYRTEAKANADAAKKLADIEDSQKSEVQKLNEQFEAARADAADARAELLRYRIASQHGITDADDIALFLTGSDEETLSKQAERLIARVEDASKPRSPRPDPNQGRNGSGPKSTADSFAEFFQNQL